MRKFSQMMMLGAMAATMWSCSSDNAPDSPDKNDPAFKGDGYLAVQIRLPQVPSSRANDNFDDGTDNEYAVDNVALILFKGKNEGDASVVGCYTLKNGFGITTDAPDNDNITTTSLEAVEVSDLTLEENDKLYGLVVANYNNNILTFTDGKNDDLTVGGNKITTFSGMLSETTQNAFYTGSGAAATNFFMTNAVLSKIPGGASDPTITPEIFTLADLTSTLYNTEEEAKRNPAGCIYIERAVAKVTSTGTTTAEIGGQKFNVTIEYALDNCEPTSFVVRNSPAGSTDFAWNLKNLKTTNYRMIGDAPMPALKDPNHTSIQYYYRTYWCTDPNYSTPLLTQAPTDYSNLEFVSLTEEKGGKDVVRPLYCHENTFDVANMTYGNTTRVIYKVTLTPVDEDGKSITIDKDNSLYIRNGDKKRIYLTLADVESLGRTEILNYPALKAALEALKKDGTGTYDITDVIDIRYTTETDGSHSIENITLNKDADNFAICFGEDAEAVIAKFENDNATMLAGLIKSVNAKNVITKYTGGVSYYDIRVAHFDDDLTPWKEQVGETPSAVYGTGADAANAYLGRYGMVRNNWYDLKVNNIIGIGSPVVPELDIDLSDDNKKDKKYIAIEVHTMSWAKRTHDYDLE